MDYETFCTMQKDYNDIYDIFYNKMQKFHHELLMYDIFKEIKLPYHKFNNKIIHIVDNERINDYSNRMKIYKMRGYTIC